MNHWAHEELQALENLLVHERGCEVCRGKRVYDDDYPPECAAYVREQASLALANSVYANLELGRVVDTLRARGF